MPVCLICGYELCYGPGGCLCIQKAKREQDIEHGRKIFEKFEKMGVVQTHHKLMAYRIRFRHGTDIRHASMVMAANELQALAVAMRVLTQIMIFDWVTGPGFTIEILSDES